MIPPRLPLILICLLAAPPLFAQELPDLPVSAPTYDPEVLQRQVQGLTERLNRLTGDLMRVETELDLLRRYITDTQQQEQFEQWRSEQLPQLAQENPDYRKLLYQQRLAEQREQQLAQREQRQQQLQTQRRQQLENQRLQRVLRPFLPRWNYHYAIDLIEEEGRTVYLQQGDLLYPSYLDAIDDHNVIVRGTVTNESQGPWRYTFELTVREDDGDRLGSWRIQTPMLEPGELTSFEATVPVTRARSAEQVDLRLVSSQPGFDLERMKRDIQRDLAQQNAPADTPDTTEEIPLP